MKWKMLSDQGSHQALSSEDPGTPSRMLGNLGGSDELEVAIDDQWRPNEKEKKKIEFIT